MNGKEKSAMTNVHCSLSCSTLRLSPHAMMGDLADLGIEDMLHYDPYDNRSSNAKTFSILYNKTEVSPEWGDQHLNEVILLPRGDKMARG